MFIKVKGIESLINGEESINLYGSKENELECVAENFLFAFY